MPKASLFNGLSGQTLELYTCQTLQSDTYMMVKQERLQMHPKRSASESMVQCTPQYNPALLIIAIFYQLSDV